MNEANDKVREEIESRDKIQIDHKKVTKLFQKSDRIMTQYLLNQKSRIEKCQSYFELRNIQKSYVLYLNYSILSRRKLGLQKIGTFGFFYDFSVHGIFKKIGLRDNFWTLPSPNFRRDRVLQNLSRFKTFFLYS